MKKMRHFILTTSILLASCNWQTDKPKGAFFSIDEAYEKSLISKEDISCIALHYNQPDNGHFQSTITYKLDEETILDIKKTHLSRVKKYVSNPSISNITISGCFGAYGDCIALTITDKYLYCDPVIYEHYEIDGVVFNNLIKGYPSGIEIWKNS